MALISSGGPGTFVQEIDASLFIPSVATTEGAMAGHFHWGPVGQRVLIDSEQELVETFGEPSNANASDWFTAANFLGYSNKLYTVRVVDEKNANVSLRATNAVASNTGGYLVKNDDHYENEYNDGSLMANHNTGEWIAKFPGALGNSLKISVCASPAAYQSNLTGTLSVAPSSTVVTGTGTQFLTELTVGDHVVLNNEMKKVKAIANATSLTLETRHVVGAVANSAIRRWEYYVEVDGAPNDSATALAKGGQDDELHIVIVDKDGEWTGQKGVVLEKWQFLSKAKDAFAADGSTLYYKEVVNKESRFVRWAGHDGDLTNAGSSASATFGAPTKPQVYMLSGGKDGAAPTANEKIPGYGMFLSTEDVDISFVLASDADVTLTTYIINNIVEVRKDCVAFFSPPRSLVVNNVGKEAQDIVDYKNSLPSTSYAAIDCNWKYQYDRYNDVYRYVPLNGDIAGVHVRTDMDRDPWWAAAGFNRGGIKNVIKLAWNPRAADRDILYRANINPVATFPGEGTVLFGQKTMLTKPSAFDRINVRRLFIVLEKAISRAAKYMLFEFNDPITRTNFVNLVEPFLRDVKGRRGIYDFRVVCDESNNSPERIDRNEFWGDIYIKPAKTAEFIMLRFVATRTGVEFSQVQI